ncbi:hypothetical protein L1887_37890 [Cichorium endivia]|nr:hypothetical protein L1887_37890 [Cichorium endivia]
MRWICDSLPLLSRNLLFRLWKPLTFFLVHTIFKKFLSFYLFNKKLHCFAEANPVYDWFMLMKKPSKIKKPVLRR